MLELLRDLRSVRYAPLATLMVVVAAICIAAGTWQIARYDGKHLANDDLRRNAHAAAVPIGSALPVLTSDGLGAAPSADGVEYRTVTATGRYDSARQVLVRKRQVNGVNGYLILTPLRTHGATLLVVRGFVKDSSATPGAVAAAPTGEVSIRARILPPETGDDKYAALANGQVDRIVPAQVARRLGTSVYDGYAQLQSGQPGSAGLTVIPEPDLSNPAGGAIEPQHLAYIVQWYLFAALALAAPVVMVRTDRKRAREDAAEREAAAAKDAIPQTTEARLADRYGRAR